jgi:N-acetylglucosamine kinase
MEAARPRIEKSEVCMLALGIDGGGTKTEAAVVSEDDAVLAVGLGGPVNTAFVSSSQARRSIRAAVREALGGAKSRHFDALALCVLCSTEDATAGLPRGVSYGQIFRFSETEVAFARAGLFQKYGIAVVAGTGSNVCGYGRDGAACHVGGWGALLGDEGSAFDIALRAIKAAIRAHDGRGPHTQLLERALRHFNIPELWGLVRLCYGGPLPRTTIADFAPQVSAAASEGDEVATGILADAGRTLADDVLFVAGRLFQPEEAFPVVLSGGVFNAGPLLIEPIRLALKQQYPNASLLVAHQSPGVAVAKLGLMALSQSSPAAKDGRHRISG